MTNCPMCDGDPTGPVFPFGTRWSGRLWEYLGCRSCGTSYIFPLPSASDLEAMYRQQDYHDQFYSADQEEQPATHLDEVRPCFQGNDLLDFGCGNGDFLKAAKAAGYSADGVELDEMARRQASAASGCEVLALTEIFAQRRRYDVIHLGDVLEHLPKPADTLRELEELLKPGGSFFIEGPIENNASLVYAATRSFGRFKKLVGWNVYADLPPFHLLRTDAASQRDFLERKMDYRVSLFTVTETGWPYWLPSDRLFRPRSPGHAVKMSIGRMAIGIAAVGRMLGLSIGNRFAAIATPAAPEVAASPA